MALNLQQLFEKIHEIGLREPARQHKLDGLREKANDLLGSWADKTAELRLKIERACQADPSLRCAVPLDELLDASCREPVLPKQVTFLAADGSQILPDRHSALLFSLVNVGAIALELGSGKAPEVFTESRLLFADELYTETVMLTEEAIQQQRDIAERRYLLELAPKYSAPILALTDGPVELWGVKGGAAEEYRRNLELHKSILSQLKAKDVIVAGYVDKPGADLVIRTLEIAQFSNEEEFKNIRKKHPLRGVTDRWLFGENALLKAGYRSAVFGLQSSSQPHYTGDLALHFFYLNVGESKHPSMVRVEIPKWVADNPVKLDLVHAGLLHQCRVMGAKPYPYILHRAHEIAVVKFEEKKQVEQMLELELRKVGVEFEGPSNKQSAKDLKGRAGRK